jgi:molybdenum-dependent DNA-binding transcriptional regulator ModE
MTKAKKSRSEPAYTRSVLVKVFRETRNVATAAKAAGLPYTGAWAALVVLGEHTPQSRKKRRSNRNG